MAQTGIVTFFGESGVALADVLPVIFSFAGNATKMGFYKQKEFVTAMQVLGLTSAHDFKTKT